MKKKILITGASSGIGAACVREFAKDGHKIIALARRLEKLEQLKKEVSAQSKVDIDVFQVDISDKNAVESFFSSNKELLSDLDVLVNNAGLALGRESLDDLDFADIQTMIDTNISALLGLSQKAIKVFKQRKIGHIVNLGSVAGLTPYAGGTVYCATKAAVHMLSDALRMDLGGSNIRVSVIAPGRVAETEFSQVRYKGDEKMAQSVYEGYRTMSSKDVAETISWVVSRPEHINIQQLVLLPTDQSSATPLALFKG